MTDRKKPGVAFWATVVVSLPVLYVLSFGPACWLARQGMIPQRTTAHIYEPIVRLPESCPEWIEFAIDRYSGPAPAGNRGDMRYQLGIELIAEMFEGIDFPETR